MTGLTAKLYFGIWKRVYTRETFLLFEQKTTPVLQSSPIIVRPVTMSNVDDAASFQTVRQRAMFKKFLVRGDKGFYAYLDGKCVHRSWVELPPQRAEVHVFWNRPLAANEVFVHFSETAPWARGQNIFTNVLVHLVGEFENKKVLISVDRDNASSIRSIRKAGFREVERIQIQMIAGIRNVRIVKTNDQP